MPESFSFFVWAAMVPLETGVLFYFSLKGFDEIQAVVAVDDGVPHPPAGPDIFSLNSAAMEASGPRTQKKIMKTANQNLRFGHLAVFQF